ncbi:hypothetical protein Lal_00010870 [Lupinus albus]|nr:hypothetical protein Lal_00010870 [Lupinus albus]
MSSSFCLSESIHESHCSSFPSSLKLKISLFYQTHTNENMMGEALEAKQRLDEKFRLLWESKNIRENMKCVERRKTSPAKMHIYGSMKSGLRKFIWTKLLCCWNVPELEDCAVCLEPLEDSESLIHLPCKHRFHSSCLKPWLDKKSHCPCCRATIIFT